jgi:hypothetical protein
VAGQTSWLDRRLARWDARNQRALDRQAVEEGRQVGREVTAIAPDGTVYRVLAVRTGWPLRGPDLDGGGGGGEGLELVLLVLVLVAMLAAALVRLVGRLLLRRPRGGWKVGVLRPRRWWWAQLVYRERLGVGGDEVARVGELARQIETGAFTSARVVRRGASLD